jgi:hypothetical protein
MNTTKNRMNLLSIAILLLVSLAVGCRAQNDQAKESIKKAHEAVSQVESQTQETLNQANKVLDDSQREESDN